MESINSKRSQSHFIGDTASGHALPSMGPQLVDDRIIFPAKETRAGMAQLANGDVRITLELVGPDKRGLYGSLSPEGARVFANMLIEMAGEADEHIAKQAAAAIEAARKNGGSQ